MKRIGLRFIAALFAFCIGIFITKAAIAYIFYPTWQSDIDSCPYFSEIKNPLCGYSPNLSEVPNVSISDLIQSPSLFDEKVIRVSGRFYSDLEDPHKSYLFMLDKDGAEKQLGVSYWSWNVSAKLCKFIDVEAPASNSANVTLVVKFLDVTNYPSVREANNGSPFVVMVLDIEQIDAIRSFSQFGNSLSRPREHKFGHYRDDSGFVISQ